MSHLWRQVVTRCRWILLRVDLVANKIFGLNSFHLKIFQKNKNVETVTWCHSLRFTFLVSVTSIVASRVWTIAFFIAGYTISFHALPAPISLFVKRVSISSCWLFPFALSLKVVLYDCHLKKRSSTHLNSFTILKHLWQFQQYSLAN